MAKKDSKKSKPRVRIELLPEKASDLADAIQQAVAARYKKTDEDKSLTIFAELLAEKVHEIDNPPDGGLLDTPAYVVVALKPQAARQLASALTKAATHLINMPRSADPGACLQVMANRLTAEADQRDPQPQRGLATPFGRHAIVKKDHG